ncbi:helix-turn-helix domain-containing protein [Mesorhizobium japonicum]|uniref:Two-component response regulator n=1 Tax=Mesorhizobium japonicum (strain LMG 29417 / CECT 9101 / MAFF 303099) TaxID=266835 RepID=Q98EY1_RHILO|nr:two-component response regulator [Mesorhizobium japonicum MAFF 303099]
MLSDLQSPNPANSIAVRARATDRARQTNILRLVVEGLSITEVGWRMELHEKTVKYHMTGVLSKLYVRNRTEAALMLREARR